MAIVQIYENTYNTLVNEKNQAVERIKQKVTQEKIVPYNAKIDKELAEALKELGEKYNQKLLEVQNEHNAEKQRFVDLANAKKTDFSTTTINTECEAVRVKYDTEIAQVRERIEANREG